MLPRNESVWIEFEPAKKKVKQKDEEVPIITLVPFTKAVHINFGTVPLGKSKECPIVIKNVTNGVQQVVVEKFPNGKGFSISDSQFSIQSNDEVIIRINWEPTEAGRFREILLLRVDGTFPSQAYLLGEVLTNKKLKNKKPFKVLHPSNVPARTSSNSNLKQLKTSAKTLNSKTSQPKVSQNTTKRCYGITIPYDGIGAKSKRVDSKLSPLTPEVLRGNKRRCRNNSGRPQKSQNRLLLTPELNRNTLEKPETTTIFPIKSHSDTDNNCADHESPPQQSNSVSGLLSNTGLNLDDLHRQPASSPVAVDTFSSCFESATYFEDNTACGGAIYTNYQDLPSVPDANGNSPNGSPYEFTLSTTDRRQTYIASTNVYSSAEDHFNFCKNVNQEQGLYLPDYEAKSTLLIPDSFPIVSPLCFQPEDANIGQFSSCNSPPPASDRRETFIATSPYLHMQREITLPSCEGLSTPLRRQTYISSTMGNAIILPEINCEEINSNQMNSEANDSMFVQEIQNSVAVYQENICPPEMYVNEVTSPVLSNPVAKYDLSLIPETSLETPEAIMKPGLNIWCKEFVSSASSTNVLLTPEMTDQWKFDNNEVINDFAAFKGPETVETGDPYIYDWPFTPQETKYEKHNYSTLQKRKINNASKFSNAKHSPAYDSLLSSPVSTKPYKMKSKEWCNSYRRQSKDKGYKSRSLESSPEISNKHRHKNVDEFESPLGHSPVRNLVNVFVSPQRNRRKSFKQEYGTPPSPLKSRKNSKSGSPPAWEYCKSVDIPCDNLDSPMKIMTRKPYSPERKGKTFSKREKSPGAVNQYPAKKLNSRQWSPAKNANDTNVKQESNISPNKTAAIDIKTAANSPVVDIFRIPGPNLIEVEIPNLNLTDRKEKIDSATEASLNYHSFCRDLDGFDKLQLLSDEGNKIAKCSTSVKTSLSPERNKQSANSLACRKLFKEQLSTKPEDQLKSQQEEPFNYSNANHSSVASKEVATTFIISSENSEVEEKEAHSKLLKNPTFQKSFGSTSSFKKMNSYKCIKRRLPTKLQLVKPTSTAVPHHPNSHSARNLYYDERWVEKQTAGFIQWLNFILSPPDDFNVGTDAPIKLLLDYSKSGPCDHVKSRESLSLGSYTACRQLNKLRRDALKLFRSDQIVEVVSRLESEIETQRLLIRKDRFLHADLGIRQHILEMILCYNSLWLRIGLEAIYGEIIPLKSNSDVAGLSRFVTGRVLCDPNIASEFAHPTVPSLFKPGYAEALKKFTLKKFLILVLFLDKAKASQLIRHNPCLFNKTSKYKSSKELLIAFSRDYLSGEGDVLKHLAYLGYRVSYVQVALDEFDFSVRNLAIDLRDGLRLTRLAELLVQNVPLLRLLRVPAISRLQKLHNTEVALAAFVGAGLQLQGVVNSQYIVDGHKEKTLAFLWKIIFHFQIKVVLDKQSLLKEIDYLERSLILKNIQIPVKHPICPHHEDDDRIDLLLKWCNLVCLHYGLKLGNFPSSFSDGRAMCYIIHHYHPELLRREQINEVTSQTMYQSNSLYAIQSSDSEDSFTYPAAEPQKIQELFKKEQENIKLAMSKVIDIGGVPLLIRPSDLSNTIPDSKVLITLLSYLCGRLLDLCEEIRAARIIQLTWRNYKKKKTEIQKREMENISAEIIQRFFKRLLFKRRLEKMERSATIIQKAWRKYCLQKSESTRLITKKEKALRLLCKFYYSYFIPKYKIRVAAAKKIQSAVRAYLERKRYLQKKNAIVNLQRLVRGHLARQEFHILKANHQIRMELHTASAIKIQRAFRAYCNRRQQQKTRKAIIQLQKYARGFLVRKQYKILQENWRRNQKEESAARKIQATFHMHLERKKFLQNKKAAIHLQKHIRRFLAWKNFKILQKQDIAARKIQAVFRGHLVRKLYFQKYNAVVVMQRFCRGYLARKHFRTLKEKAEHEKMELSAIVIQKTARMFLARKHFLKLQQLTIKLQALVRRKLAKSLLQKLKQERAAIKIQTYYRMYCKQQKYQKKKLLITKLQSVCRGFVVRRNLRIQLEKRQAAALKIQRHFRNYLNQKSYRKAIEAVICIQAFVRGALVRKRMQKTKGAVLAKKIHSAIIIQTAYRGYQNRRRYKQLQFSIILLQAVVRGYLVRKYESNKRHAVITIQNWYRACKLGNKEKNEYLKMRTAAIKIQAWIRMKLCRREFLKMKWAAIAIQTHYRRKVAVDALQIQLYAVLTIQKHFRNYLLYKRTRESYLKLRSTTILIQTVYRQIIQKRKIAHDQKILAAVTIQKYFRRYLAQKNFTNYRNAAIMIQNWYRAVLLGRHIRNRYLQLQIAAVTIQSKYRGNKVRKHLLEQKRAASKIQGLYRGWKLRLSLKKENEAARIIQHFYHHWKMGKMQRNKFVIQRYACIVIQSAVRTYLAKCKYKQYKKAVLYIQAFYRSYLVRKHYCEMREAAICIQVYYRRYLAMKVQYVDYHITRGAIIAIQCHYRGYIVRKEFLKKKQACIKIQSVFRGFLVRKEFERLKSAVITIQRRYRTKKHVQNCVEEFHITRGAVITLQAYLKGWLIRKDLQSKTKAAIQIQRRYRWHLACLHIICKAGLIVAPDSVLNYAKIHDLAKIHAAIMIQRKFRSYLEIQIARQKFINTRKAVIKIQHLYRNHLQRKRAAVVLQQKLPRFLLAVKERKHFLRKKQAVVTIQTAWRKYVVQKHYIAVKRATIVIQSAVRTWSSRRKFLYQKQAVRDIEEWYLSWRLQKLTYENYHIYRGAVITIQNFYRKRKLDKLQDKGVKALLKNDSGRYFRNSMQHDRLRFLQVRIATIVIQKWWKQILLMRRERATYLAIRSAIIRIQSVVRMFPLRRQYQKTCQSVMKIQAWYRMKLTRRIYLRKVASAKIIQQWYRNKAQKKKTQVHAVVYERKIFSASIAATRIQSYWRGFALRKTIKNKKLLNVSQRLQTANENATEEMKLNNLTTNGLDYLFKYQDIPSVLSALKKLDAASRLSPVCCQRIADANGITVLYNLISSCNRSVPHIEIIILCISILLNLAKYQPTMAAVWKPPEAFSTIFNLMSIYREKKTLIFTKCCSLLWIFGQDANAAKILKSVKWRGKLQHLNQFIRNKFKLEQQWLMKKAATSRTNVSIYADNAMCTIQPDWVLGRHMREFQSPMKASEALLALLEIKH